MVPKLFWGYLRVSYTSKKFLGSSKEKVLEKFNKLQKAEAEYHETNRKLSQLENDLCNKQNLLELFFLSNRFLS